jgi:hypothetical protein
MYASPPRGWITLVIFAFLMVGLMVSCATVSTPTDHPRINIPVVNIAGTPTIPGTTIPSSVVGTGMPDVTPSAAFTNTPSPSSTVTREISSTASVTIAPSPTVTQAVIWGAGIPQAIVLERFRGQWLPADEKMIGNILIEPVFGAIYMAEAPRFALREIQPENQDTLGIAFSGSPGGKWVVYGSVPLVEYNPDWTEFSTLTRLNNQNERVESLFVGEGHLQRLSIPGWLDTNTIAMSDFLGNGFYRYSLIDITRGSVLARVQARGPSWRPSSAYLPVAEENGGPYQLFVVTRNPQSEAYNTISGPNYFARGFPPEYIAPDMNVLFRDWLPGTNRLLVQAFLYDRETFSITHSVLMLWDVDSKVVQVLLNAALDGRFSPNGEWLAFVTLGSAPLYADGTPSFDLGMQIPTTLQTYLQIMDTSSRAVRLSLPVVTALDLSTGYVLDIYDTPLVFSSDSRYLAFLTPGLVVYDSSGKLGVLLDSQDSRPYLNVLDLYTLQPLLSTPAGAVRDFYFSPNSEWLAFQAQDGNWYLLELANNQIQALTIFGGERLLWNGWSSNSNYLSYYEPVAEGFGRTVVLGLIR